MRETPPADTIILRGVAVHNLRQVDLDLPKNRLIAVCGVSGAGKTSLALDTVYAQGQRQYVETLSPYARQFVARLDPPEAERLDGIPASVALLNDASEPARRATVGTATQAYDALRMLFAQIGQVRCTGCSRVIRPAKPEAVTEEILAVADGATVLVACPVPTGTAPIGGPGQPPGTAFTRVIHQGKLLRSERLPPPAPTEPGGELLGIVDRLRGDTRSPQRVRDSVETALRLGHGECVILCEPIAAAPNAYILDGQPWQRRTFSERWRCPDCRLDYLPPEPHLFSFNSSLGACPACRGTGIERLTGPGTARAGEAGPVCPACGGNRLRPEALAVHVESSNIGRMVGRSVAELRELAQAMAAEPANASALPLLDELSTRLQRLSELGMDHLQLGRSLRTLSRGELHAVKLAAIMASSLVGLLYVLDEPSAPLHVHERPRLQRLLTTLRDRGNTLLIVDHDLATVRLADWVVELGPGAGADGGQVTYAGPPQAMHNAKGSPTGDYLSGRREFVPPETRRETRGWLRLTGARGNNLRDLTADIPLGVLCAVTGVSGAGKSTLVHHTLFAAIARQLKKLGPEPLPFDGLAGAGQIEDTVLLDRATLARTGRSNPVSLIGAFADIRTLFAETTDAKLRNYSPGHFSFHRGPGQCPDCQGAGVRRVDMQFLPDALVPCAACEGSRYRREILDIRYRGLNVADVLDLTSREAFRFFRGRTRVQAALKRLMDAGLGHLPLGQPGGTLSGGEVQRARLAAWLAARQTRRTLLVLEEPSQGLHPADLSTLLDAFAELVALGHSVLFVDHHLHLIASADYVLDLGPGGGAAGGRLVAAGTPEEVAACGESFTGRYLGPFLATARGGDEATVGEHGGA